MYQQTIILGNVGGDPDMRYTPQGVAVCDFTVAVNKVTGSGETRKETTTWFKVTFWRERAETVARLVKKGTKIMVVGEVSAEAYTNKSGQPTASLKLTGSEFKLLSSRGDGDDPEAQPARPRGKPDGKASNYEVSDDIPF